MLVAAVRRSFSCFSLFLLWDYFIYLSHKHKRSYQRGIITKIKRSRGADFSDVGVHHLSQQWADLSESPFFVPPKNTLTHTIQSYFTHLVVSLNLDKPQGYKKHSTVFVFSFSPTLFLTHFLLMQSSTYHVQAKQCPHVSVVQPQRLGEIFSGQLQVFQPPLSVLHLWGGIKHGQ